MTYSVSFQAASVEDAAAILAEENLPEPVRAFAVAALAPFAGRPVSVYLSGHVAADGNETTAISGTVGPVDFRRPRPVDAA